MRARMVLPKSRDGQYARQLGSLVGDDMVQFTRETSGDFYWPVPVGYGPPAYVHKGEFLKPIMGGTGFASLSDLISEATTGGKQQTLPYAKVGVLSLLGGVEVGWLLNGLPGIGVAPAAVPGGTIPTNASAGSLGQADPGGTDTLHLASVAMAASGNAAVGILYDRLAMYRPNTNSAATQAITGTITRYTGTTDSRGNFAFPYIATVLPATAHNFTVCKYTDDAGNTGQSFASATGNTSGAANRVDLPLGQWYMPLLSGDYGIQNVEQYQQSAAVATGQIDFAVGHPLAIIPMPASGVAGIVDGINSAFNMTQIQTGACLDMLILRPATGATSLTGIITMVSG